MTPLHELSQARHQLEVEKVAADYVHITPRLEFGRGGIAMLERLVGFEEHGHIYNCVRDPATAVTGGWIALEIASHLPDSSKRQEFLNKSTQRFEAIAELHSSEDTYERLTSYQAGLGLIAVNAYSTDSESAMYDTPGMYAELIERLLTDNKLRHERSPKQWGLLGELTVGAVISSLDLMTLPASVRHDKPVNTETPSFAHDLQVWFNLPEKLPHKPDRHIQVKTGLLKYKHVGYSDAISVLNTNHEFKNRLRTIARSIVTHYSGEKESISMKNVLRNSQLTVLECLNRPIGHDNYQYRGHRMRGSSNRGK